MPYSELHFSSAVDSATVAHKGTRNRRILEFNTPAKIQLFHLRNIEIPFYFTTAPSETFTFEFQYSVSKWTFTANFNGGALNGNTFRSRLEDAFRTVGAAAVETPGISGTPAPIRTTITVAINNNTSRLEIGFPDGPLVGPPNQTFVSFSVNWPASWKSLLSRSFLDNNLTRTATASPLTSLGPLRLAPGCFYVHSNIMATSATSLANQRAHGDYNSRTIMTRIPVDTDASPWGGVIVWDNPCLEPALMFQGSDQELSYIEFWITDEFGVEIDFNMYAFSLTLAVINHTCR